MDNWPVRATTDPDKIIQLWTYQPNRNIGIACGMGSGVFVLDIDPGKGGDDALWELEAKYGPLPHTWEVLTPTGGSHKFFRAVPNISNSVSTVGAGLDIRGEGGQVVAAGSRRACGTYQWELSSHPDDTPLADAPEWLLNLIFEKGEAPSKLYSGTVVREELVDWQAIREGCPTLAYASGEGQPFLKRPAWRHVVLNVISFCRDAHSLAHEASRDHPKYSSDETDREIHNAITKTHAPARCSKIATAYDFGKICQRCPHYGTRLGTPVTLGKPKMETWTAGTSKSTLPQGVNRWPEYPCYAAITNMERDFPIRDADRDQVLFAMASHDRGQEHKQHISKMNLQAINEKRCRFKLSDEEIGKVVDRVFGSQTVLSPGCDSLQAADLCPAKSGKLPCPIFNIGHQRTADQDAAVSSDTGRLTLTPTWVMRTVPPIYTVTVKGQKVTVKHDILFDLRLFQKAVLAATDEIPEIEPVPYEVKDDKGGSRIKYIPLQTVWIRTVNEALRSAIELPLPPEDASEAGVIWDSIQDFLANKQISEDRDCILINNVLREEGNYYFRGRALRAWLKRNSLEPKDHHALWMAVRDHGGESAQIRTSEGKKHVWYVPVAAVGGIDVTREREDEILEGLFRESS